MKTCNFIPYGKQHIDEEDCAAVVKALQGEQITRGEEVERFEKALAETLGACYAVAFSHGTAAISAAGFAADWGPEDLVVTSPNSFVGSVCGAIQSECSLVFSDVDPATGNLSFEDAWKNLMLPRSRGRKFFMPVHYAGIPMDLSNFELGIQSPDLIIIEDACHALGARYPSGELVGSCVMSAMTVFSLHPAKSITMGEGGAVLTNNEHYYRRLLQFRNNGIKKEEGSPPWYYEVQALTGNYNVTSFQAALAESQLRKLFFFVEERRKLTQCYRKHLQGVPHLKLLPEGTDAFSAHHLFVCLIDFSVLNIGRAELMQSLKDEGIGSQVHFIPLYKHPAIQNYLGSQTEPLEGMEAFYSQALSLPLFYGLTVENVEHVCNLLKKKLKS